MKDKVKHEVFMKNLKKRDKNSYHGMREVSMKSVTTDTRLHIQKCDVHTFMADTLAYRKTNNAHKQCPLI